MVWPEQRLQMQRVIELDAARILRAFPQCRKLGVILAEALNRASHMQVGIAGMQVRMALGANRVRCGSQPGSSFVFYVAGPASRGERLTGVVQRRVVAGKTSLVRDVLKISARHAHMAQLAALREHGMRS
jgi:hypothetical protein